MSQFFIGLAIKSAHFDQSRVHPLTEQFDSLTLACAFNAIDQHYDRRALLLMQLKLSLKKGFTQGGSFPVVGFFIDEMADFS